LKNYSLEDLELLLYADGIKVKNPTPEWHKTLLYERLIPCIERSFLKKEDGEKIRYGKEIKRFLKSLEGVAIDYLVWFSPFKLLEFDFHILDLPKACIFDVQALGFEKIKYNEKTND
jgi:hypothetical protein